jgi:hypothetical protein
MSVIGKYRDTINSLEEILGECDCTTERKTQAIVLLQQLYCRLLESNRPWAMHFTGRIEQIIWDNVQNEDTSAATATATAAGLRSAINGRFGKMSAMLDDMRNSPSHSYFTSAVVGAVALMTAGYCMM